MRVSLMLSVAALGLFPLVACEFHAGVNDPPAAPTTTPAATAAPTTAPTTAATTAPTATTPPAPTGPKVVTRTTGVHLPPMDPDAGS